MGLKSNLTKGCLEWTGEASLCKGVNGLLREGTVRFCSFGFARLMSNRTQQ